MNTEDVTEMQIYRPRTAQTKAVYEMLLNRGFLSLQRGRSKIQKDTCAMPCHAAGLQQPLGDQAGERYPRNLSASETLQHDLPRTVKRIATPSSMV